MQEAETCELVEELTRRGHTVVTCEHDPGRMAGGTQVPLCGKPASGRLNGLDVCEDCRRLIVRAGLHLKYSPGGPDKGEREALVNQVHRWAMDGVAPEDIAKRVDGMAAITMEELARLEEWLIAGRKVSAWLVWGCEKGSPFGPRRVEEMLVLARSDVEAKKVWREYLYNRKRDIPDSEEAIRVPHHGCELGPMVISTSVEFELGYKLGVEA